MNDVIVIGLDDHMSQYTEYFVYRDHNRGAIALQSLRKYAKAHALSVWTVFATSLSVGWSRRNVKWPRRDGRGYCMLINDEFRLDDEADERIASCYTSVAT